MQKKVKKIIAREFLVLLGSFIAFIIIVVCWELMVERNSQNRYKTQQELSALTEYEKMPFRVRVLYYMNENIKVNSYKIRQNKYHYIEELKDKKFSAGVHDTLQQSNLTTMSALDFQSKCIADNESEDYLHNLLFLEEKSQTLRNSIFYNNLDTREMSIFLVIMLSFTFFLRYIIYITRWSIRQLKEN